MRALSEVAGLPDFQRMMRIAAQRTGRLINQSEIARDAGLAQATCHRYLNLLATGFQIVRLPPYAANPTKPLVKSPKLFWGDTGVAAWLAGIENPTALQQRADAGFWLEQAVFQTLQSWRGIAPSRRRLSYWRTRGGDEVDFILEQDQTCVAIEVKTGARVTLDDASGLRRFADSVSRSGQFVRGVVLHGGTDARPLASNMDALPHSVLLPDINGRR